MTNDENIEDGEKKHIFVILKRGHYFYKPKLAQLLLRTAPRRKGASD
jgi:hypothetical protein